LESARSWRNSQGGRCPDKIRSWDFNRRGLTDEGRAPGLFSFRQDNEEVIVHFARIGGEIRRCFKFHRAVFSRPEKLRDAGAGVAGYPSVCFAKAAFVAIDRFFSAIPAHTVGRLGGHGPTSRAVNLKCDCRRPAARPEKSFGWFLDRHDQDSFFLLGPSRRKRTAALDRDGRPTTNLVPVIAPFDGVVVASRKSANGEWTGAPRAKMLFENRRPEPNVV